MENKEIELLESIQNRLSEMEAREKRRSRQAVVKSIIISLLVIALLAFVYIKVAPIVTGLSRLNDAIEDVDLELVAEKLNELAACDFTGLENLLDYLSTIDMEEYGKTIDSTKEMLDFLTQIDFDKLKDTLDFLSKFDAKGLLGNLDVITEKLAPMLKIGEKKA